MLRRMLLEFSSSGVLDNVCWHFLTPMVIVLLCVFVTG